MKINNVSFLGEIVRFCDMNLLMMKVNTYYVVNLFSLIILILYK